MSLNDLVLTLGWGSLKPIVTALILPPVPWLLMILWGARAIARRRPIGKRVLGVGLALVWLSACTGVADWLGPALLPLPIALSTSDIDRLRTEAAGPGGIVILGGGVQAFAPEYASSSLHFRSLERLRYGLWLSRHTGWPAGFSGGVGWEQPAAGSDAEAVVAQRIATQEYRQPLSWVESRSRDTRENALNTVELLKQRGVHRVLLVTHAWHMPRALRDFERASGGSIAIRAAPIGLASANEVPALRWLPTGDGAVQVRLVLREWLGLKAGA